MSWYRGLLDTPTWDLMLKNECDFTDINLSGVAKPQICEDYYNRWFSITLGAKI